MNTDNNTITPQTTLAELGIKDANDIEQVQRVLARMGRTDKALDAAKDVTHAVITAPIVAVNATVSGAKITYRGINKLTHKIGSKIEDTKAIRIARKERENKQREADSVKGHKILTKLQQTAMQEKMIKDANKLAAKDAKRMQKEQEALTRKANAEKAVAAKA